MRKLREPSDKSPLIPNNHVSMIGSEYLKIIYVTLND